ncbi:MAG: DUF3368 domain-containing protein [Microscillaceae bacterium]|jgi:predicted nucleic acid-binding protein|nr:DUF3368 domain-containing protein [Microscillaceae bacterium]
MLNRVIIADTSCLITLSKLNLLGVLADLYKEVLITPIIAKEFGEPIPNWLIIKDLTDDFFFLQFCLQVDEGEASAIALAMEFEDCILILDDWKARKLAQQYQKNATGTLGTLLKAKNQNLIPNIQPLLNQMKINGFHFSEELEKEILRLANEL